ncbi:proteasome assembly chaperone family protein [Saccharomonospora azurea]|uniref:ATP-grasp superfamily enzyme n=1 Tax=Saccharomonospora azurea NA-128 TaxID=882081 RepID=H8G6U5_9PSEU|nr:PAC2 family protein [Saccharomonospora azurea]EHK89033.1 ATP-grasp superfamily enzyme [Saccharomonospora azurea SZMC 14600]EHY91328.1 ATP-grasp superfamily enzyme [Saccharomonospora azurea NA-128]
MDRNPEQLYDLDSGVSVPEEAVLLYHFDGFVDAGSAGRILVDHLRSEFDGPVVARFDVDRLLDYRSRRPTMTFAADHWAGYEDPELVVRLLHDVEGTPVLLFTGPEPDVQWETFIAAVRELIQRWRVRLSVTAHGIPMGVPHTRPLGLTAHATRPELVRSYRSAFTHVQVPGSAGALLQYRLGQAGHDALGFAAHVPHYLAQSRYPAAALRLFDAVTEATGLHVPLADLREAAHAANLEIDRQVEDSTEVAEVVTALERQYDAFTEASPESNLLADTDEMPSGDELAADFERFLAEQQQGRSEPGEG